MDYWTAIDGLNAQDQLEQLSVVSYPQSTKQGRKDIVRTLKGRVNKVVKKSSDGLKSMNDLYAQVAGNLNGRRKN